MDVSFKRLDHGSQGRDDTLFSLGVFVLGSGGCILDTCPNILLIRDNSCNSWMFLLKDRIPAFSIRVSTKRSTIYRLTSKGDPAIYDFG